MPVLLLITALVAPIASSAEEPRSLPGAYRCSGNEPFWGIRIEESKATYTAMGAEPLELSGTSRKLDYAGLFVFRGAASEGRDWVAFVFDRSCTDTMAEESEGGGRMPFSIALSLPEGDLRTGCCRASEPGQALDPEGAGAERRVALRSSDPRPRGDG